MLQLSILLKDLCNKKNIILISLILDFLTDDPKVVIL